MACDFQQCGITQTSLSSLLFSLETQNDVQSVALHSYAHTTLMEIPCHGSYIYILKTVPQWLVRLLPVQYAIRITETILVHWTHISRQLIAKYKLIRNRNAVRISLSYPCVLLITSTWPTCPIYVTPIPNNVSCSLFSVCRNIMFKYKKAIFSMFEFSHLWITSEYISDGL